MTISKALRLTNWFKIVLSGTPTWEVNDPNNIPNLRVIPAEVPDDLLAWISKVNLVERLRETRVFYSFERLDPSRQLLAGMPRNARVCNDAAVPKSSKSATGLLVAGYRGIRRRNLHRIS
jgi:hypothetical protein